MKLLFCIAAFAFLMAAYAQEESCTPTYDADDGSVVNSHCAQQEVEVKEQRAPASMDDVDAPTVEPSADQPDTGYDQPLEDESIRTARTGEASAPLILSGRADKKYIPSGT
jgi:hypothetical protein